MLPIEYNKIITGLTQSIAGLRDRRPSAGRRLLVQSIVADVDEVTAGLKREVLSRVSREIWLEADEGIEYAALAEDLQPLLPVELPKADEADEEVCGKLNDAADALVVTLIDIADNLDRHHKNEDYIKLYEDEMRKFIKNRHRHTALRAFEQWREKDCLGSPKMEDLEDFRAMKLLKLFATGIFNEHVGSMQRARHYADEVVFQVSESDKWVPAKDIHKHYHSLRQICGWDDHGLTVNPLLAGIYFYTHRKDANAKDQRKAFLKYMTKVELAQQEMASMRQRRGTRLAELPDSRRSILDWLVEMVGYGEWVAPASEEKILEMLQNALGVGMYDLMGEEAMMSETLWSMLEQTGNLRVVWQNLIGYFSEHRFFVPTLGAPALNEMFFGNTEYYQNIDKGRPSYQRKSKKWARVQPLLDRFVPQRSSTT